MTPRASSSLAVGKGLPGADKASVYGELRVHQAPLTRLGMDAQYASQWRRLGFEPVLNERNETAENQLAASVLWRSLELKQHNPLPTKPVLSDSEFDFSLNRANTCPRLGEFNAHASNQPLAGMPYGFPGLKPQELDVIRQWLQAGSPDDTGPELPKTVSQQVAAWEQLLNGPSRKDQLVARYLYEHLFLGHLKFEGDLQGHVFRLVRSTTPPGKPAQLIATRRPFDHPGTERPFYRLVHRSTKLDRPRPTCPMCSARHIWRGGASGFMKFLLSWMLCPVTTLRSPQTPSKPLRPFRCARATVSCWMMRAILSGNFIKGPVCRDKRHLM